MTKLIRVLLDLTRMAAADLLARANAIYAGLNLNPAYPNPPIPMHELRLAIDDYSAAITAALDGGAKAIAQRNASGEALSRMLRKLAHYVEANCNGDMTTFLSSGFQPKITARARAHTVSESIRKVAPGPATGQAVVTLVKVPDAVSYELRWAAIASGGSPGDWTNQPVPSTRAFTVTGLTPGTTYTFQARAVTRYSGLTDWSESVTRICT
jgi:hypothetical protein